MPSSESAEVAAVTGATTRAAASSAVKIRAAAAYKKAAAAYQIAAAAYERAATDYM